MFSTLTNMLPNLSLQGDKDQATPNASTINPFDKLMAVKRRFEGARTSTSVAEPEPEPQNEPEEERREERKERRKQKPLNETFVVVRPPPSVSNHPLNLQLQLVPPANQTNHAPRSASTSTTGSTSSAVGDRVYAAAGGVPNVPPISAGLQSRKETAEPQQDEELLNRRANRSDLSLFYSSMASSSVTSFSTVASTTTSSARRIIPLYNLSAHNVLQNTVQDAGTDATVSRFRKRGIEIIGLGILEPIELHGQLPAGTVVACQPEFEPSDAGHGSAHGGVSESDHSPQSEPSYIPEHTLRERPSRSFMGRTSPSPPTQLREVYTEELPKEPSKKFFSKLFKKKETPVPSSPGLLSPTVQARPQSAYSARPTSVYSVVPPSPATIAPPTPTSTSASLPFLQPPILGTQAMLRSESYPPPSRPAAYVWVLRKWTKGGGMFSNGVDMGRVGVEVRFEWVRGKKKREPRERGEYQSPTGRPVSIASVDGLGIPDGGSIRSVSPDMRSRPRRDSKRSASPVKRNPSSSDSGDESDPEDSETPWSCTLRVIPLDPPTPGSAPTEPLKLRLAHLVPAPHHPKVIGQFKMPFPLPDVNIQSLQLVPRSANDPFGMDSGKSEGMVLSAEEIKDVVCTTGLWLMVREGFGGLAGKKRKGDGWKIRS